jgi:flagellar motor switch protein FliN/FliY
MKAESVSVVDLPVVVAHGMRDAKLGTRLDLVEHLKVLVSVVAGTTEVSAGELFALAAGAVLPLNEAADSPVEIQVNGKTIARGLLVAAGDQLGVRITDILPQ